MAGQTTVEIAARLGLGDDVVEAYEQIFFHVRGRLGASDYISAIVIGIFPHEGFPTTDALLKGYAYQGGPLVLDAVIAVLDAREPSGGGAAGAEPANGKLVRMALAARMLPVNAKTTPGLIRLQARLRQIEVGAAADTFLDVPIRVTAQPWPAPAIGEGSGSPGRAIANDLGSATPAEPIREGTGDRAGAIAVAFPGPDRVDLDSPLRRTA